RANHSAVEFLVTLHHQVSQVSDQDQKDSPSSLLFSQRQLHRDRFRAGAAESMPESQASPESKQINRPSGPPRETLKRSPVDNLESTQLVSLVLADYERCPKYSA